MSVGGSLRRTVGRWYESFGTRDLRAVGDLIDHEAPGLRHGPPACDLCGRRLLLGEPLSHFHKDDGLVVICPVCEPEALLVGYVRLPSEGDETRWHTFGGQVARVERRPVPVTAAPAAEVAPATVAGRRGKRLKTAA